MCNVIENGISYIEFGYSETQNYVKKYQHCLVANGHHSGTLISQLEQTILGKLNLIFHYHIVPKAMTLSDLLVLEGTFGFGRTLRSSKESSDSLQMQRTL